MGTSSKRHAAFFRLVVFIVLLGLSSGFGFAQAQPRANPQQSASADNSQQETATFRASTRLVLVDLVVTDKNGQTVKGLKAMDFTVLEDGKPQPVRAFESRVWQQTAASVEKVKLAPNQYTNFTEREPNRAVDVVLLDVLNTPQQDQQYARKQMIDFLRDLPRGHRIALFVLGTKLRMMQGFSGNSERLVEAAQAILSNTSPFLTTNSQYEDTASDIAYFADMAGAGGGSLGSLKANLMNALDAEVNAQANMRARMTLDALSSLAGAVSGYSGRKNLFWLSGNFPFRLGPDFSNDPVRFPDNYAGAIRETAALLLASQIAVYPIDARGVQTSSVSASARPQVTMGSANDQVLLAQNRTYTDYADMKSAMDDIARETGGQAFIGNDLKKIMERGIDDSGLKLEYRRGYYAVAEREAPASQAGMLLFAAMQPSVPESTMLLMRVQVLMPDKEHDKIRIDYAVAPQDISFTDTKDGRKHSLIDFVAALYSKDGKISVMRWIQ
jgi:VWFA-related protein